MLSKHFDPFTLKMLLVAADATSADYLQSILKYDNGMHVNSYTE